MSSIAKPKIVHDGLVRNKLGLTVREYEGGMSTLCAGCGHDSVTAALVQAFFELSIPPHKAAKISGIGCSSKTTAYFLGQSHGNNTVHGRMPSVITGAAAVNQDLKYIGVSGDGDSLSIGLGQFAHVIRRNLDMTYVIENNGVYGLTKGQFSASADVGSKSKGGDVNLQSPIDPVRLAMTLGATFVARGFSGDKAQLVPLLKAALSHKGFALVDVISPCVTFNDHASSTKSYAHTYKYYHPAVHADFVPPAEEIKVAYEAGEAMPVELHDGSTIVLRKTDVDYDPHDFGAAFQYLSKAQVAGEIATGLLYIAKDKPDLHDITKIGDNCLNQLPYEKLVPGAAKLKALHKEFR